MMGQQRSERHCPLPCLSGRAPAVKHARVCALSDFFYFQELYPTLVFLFDLKLVTARGKTIYVATIDVQNTMLSVGLQNNCIWT